MPLSPGDVAYAKWDDARSKRRWALVRIDSVDADGDAQCTPLADPGDEYLPGMWIFGVARLARFDGTNGDDIERFRRVAWKPECTEAALRAAAAR